MVFGIDDFLAATIAASTSYLAWSKVDHLMERVIRSKPQLRRRFERASESPTFLMKGFDVTTSVNLPHKGRFNHRRSTAFLLRCSQEDMEAHIPMFSKAEIHHAFEVVGKNGLWSQGIALTKACVACDVEVRPMYVEATLHACISNSEFPEGAAYYAAYGHSMPIEQAIITALVGGNASYPEVAMRIVDVARTGHRGLEPDLLSAVVTATAHCDWVYAMGIYGNLRASWPEYSVRDTLATLTSAALQDVSRLDWLFDEVARSCPIAQVDVALRLLETPHGSSYYNDWARREGRADELASWGTASLLYSRAPTPSNALVCSQVLMGLHYNPREVVRVVSSSGNLSDLQWGALGAVVGRSEEGAVAAELARQMILKSSVSPALILKPVAKQGMWATALRLLTLSLTHRRVVPSSSEIGLAIHASISLRKWASAVFWMDRSHASLTRLPPSTYDCLFEASRHVPWDSTERVVRSMREVGDNCTESGILTLLSAAAEQRRTPDVLRLLTNSNAISWIP